ncbi:MAG: methyltransferase domain-containing protein [Rhizomicrobium sp.]|jgi:2-polyprenyl-3-methyl-5-hydroxy-6-metoxy-1,4-benzoquinol methylase
MVEVSEAYPHLRRAIAAQLSAFADHEAYLQTRFAESGADELAFADDMAERIVKLTGPALHKVCQDYAWLCGVILDEELYFRRTGHYQLSTFAEALAKVYANSDFMSRYLNGILMSQLWWRNHAEVLRFFRDVYLPGNPSPFTHLEVGPGHGLFLHLAAQARGCSAVEGWDVSASSLKDTRAALEALGTTTPVTLRQVDLVAAPRASFRSITISEVLEHLDDPAAALAKLFGLLENCGRIFVNAPVNSPAPDHIYLFQTPEEVVEMVEGAGFKVERTLFAPCTGATLERARKLKLSISAVVIATKKH